MTSKIMRAPPPYLGSKRRLAPLIATVIREHLPEDIRQGARLLDPFCGSAAFALTARSLGFSVIASDLAERGAIVARALIANSSTRLRLEDVLALYEELPASYPKVAGGFVPSVFTERQAAWLDRAIAQSRRFVEPTRSLLQLVIIRVSLRLHPLSVLDSSDARAAAIGDYDRVSPRRLGHYLNANRQLRPDAAWRIAEQINHGVFGGRGRALRGDARDIIRAADADVVYLDPPYPGTADYAKSYAPLDALLGDADLGGPPPTLDELLEASSRVPLLALSYGGPRVTLETLTATVERHRTVLRAIAIPYPHLPALATEEHRHANCEYLVIAGR